MKNAFIFHGTEGYPEENWFPWLKDKLEALDYKVFVPQFPSLPIIPAKILEWFDVLKEYEDQINEETIIIGHSLGGVFTLRVLEKLSIAINTVALIGTPIGIKPILYYDRDSSFSGFDFEWGKIKRNAKNFLVFHSDDDPYVCLGNGEKLAENLNAKLNFVPNAGHFNKESGYLEFDLLLEKLKPIL
ncbi:alpha/beta hydrolase [Patescibacteria group bacterium]|nr:alpha/beta hydrolase [Patescibacteria group bacterium]